MEERVMRELTELVLRYKEIQEEIAKLQESFHNAICSMDYEDSIHVAEDWFLKNISSFSVAEWRSPSYAFELYFMIEGIKIWCITNTLPEGCEL
jgi:hypothetical protein